MNLIVETSIAAWLRSLPEFEGVAIHAGQSDEEIPGDQPVLIAACEQDELVGEGLHRITGRLIISSPGHLEVETHTQLVSSLREIIYGISSLSDHMPESAHLAGAVLNSFSESQTDGRRFATAEIILGVAEI